MKKSYRQIGAALSLCAAHIKLYYVNVVGLSVAGVVFFASQRQRSGSVGENEKILLEKYEAQPNEIKLIEGLDYTMTSLEPNGVRFILLTEKAKEQVRGIFQRISEIINRSRFTNY